MLTASPQLAPRSVLVVEDDPDARALLQLMLDRRGHDVIAVDNAEDALALLRKRSIDVVVTDENLPAMPGSRLLHEAFAEGLLVPERAIMCPAGWMPSGIDTCASRASWKAERRRASRRSSSSCSTSLTTRRHPRALERRSRDSSPARVGG